MAVDGSIITGYPRKHKRVPIADLKALQAQIKRTTQKYRQHCRVPVLGCY